MNTTTILFSMFAELIAAAMAVALIFRQAQKIDSIHHWKAEHLREIGAQVCVLSAIGMGLSYAFAFNADNSIFSTIASVMFMTFMYPFMANCWISDWPREPRPSYKDSSAMTAIKHLGECMVLLGVATWAACMNSSHSEIAFATGASVGLIGAAALFLGGGLLGERPNWLR
ncbi:hypothetical protein KA344_15625 [bacterium]|jgi:uncharacterized membrane protein YfcA|nr:hypothetical protein [bacterium]